MHAPSTISSSNTRLTVFDQEVKYNRNFWFELRGPDLPKRTLCPNFINETIIKWFITPLSQKNETSYTLHFRSFTREPSFPLDKSVANFFAAYLFQNYGIIITHVGYENQELISMRVKWGRDNLKLKPFRELDSGQFDYKIRIGDHTFDCHKTILASRSPYFECLFRFHREAFSELVLPEKTNPVVFKEILDYIYTGKIKDLDFKDIDTLLIFLDLASHFLLDHLQLKCVLIVRNYIDNENVQNILKTACFRKIDDLIRPCNKHLIANITKENVNTILLLAKQLKQTNLLKACEEFKEKVLLYSQ